MTEQELIDFITSDLTVGGQLQLNLNIDEMKRIIKAEKEMAHRDWRDAVELKHAIMNPAAFRTAAG